MMRSMGIDMNDEQVHTLSQLRTFLDGTVALAVLKRVRAREIVHNVCAVKTASGP